jgi:hypothetical protein
VRVLCLNIPRFAVEAERQRRKDTSARLVLVGDAAVHDCSLGGEVSGVRRGMRMSEAIGLCPRAAVIPPDLPYYQRLFDAVLGYLETLSPDIEPVSPGLAYVSLQGLGVEAREFADGAIAGVHRRCGFLASAGVAEGKFAAWAAALGTRPGAVKALAEGEEAAFLAPLSIEHLPTNDAVRWRLSLLGLATMGDIARLPAEAMQAQFGAEGRRWHELARGIDSEPLRPRVREETVTRRLQMPSPAVTLDAIMMAAERLVHAAYGQLGGGRWVRKAVLLGACDGGGTWELPVAFREALSNPREAWFAVKTAITRRPPERPLEELELELTGLGGESGKQAGMFEGKGRLWRQVEEAVRQLEAQQPGANRAAIGKAVPLEPRSRIPERRAALADLDV